MHVLIVVTSTDTLSPGHPTGVWLEEFALPYLALVEAGIAVTVASPKGGAAPIDPRTAPDDKTPAMWRGALGALAATVPLSEVSEARFDALYLPGGHGPMVDLVGDRRLKSLVAAFDRAGKIVAAVCHGPAGLLGAKSESGDPILAGRRVTGFTNGEETLAGLAATVPFSLEDAMRKEGGLFEHALLPMIGHVVCDGNLITGQNPASSLAIGRTLVEALADRQRAATAGSVAAR
ncbi:MAG: type 1 glutamine amidotransferase domain-containing protein [Caulobacteraceae bacterium]